MMNIERLTVGMQGLGFSEIAYQNALAYAQDRRQSKAPAPRPDPEKAADPIIYQPDVKRQLLTMRSQIEGARMLAMFAAFNVDTMEKTGDEAAANKVALLTPVVKAFFTDLGMECTMAGVQIYGGHGYIVEHGMEQLVRDCRITPIYEGTNEVQALDLVSRKLSGKVGEFASGFLDDWKRYLADQVDDDAVNDIAGPALAALERLIEATDWIQGKLGDDDAAVRGAATQYLRLFALSFIGCLWTEVIVNIKDKNGKFYDNKRKIARFYMEQILPQTSSLRDVVIEGSDVIKDFDVADFQEN